MHYNYKLKEKNISKVEKENGLWFTLLPTKTINNTLYITLSKKKYHWFCEVHFLLTDLLL